MPVHACVAQAAEDYSFNNSFLLNTVKNLTPEQWLKRPTACTNHASWIVGHVIWSEKRFWPAWGRRGPLPGWGCLPEASSWMTRPPILPPMC